MTCGQLCLHILRFCALHLTHPKCTHTAVNTHTLWTHTRSSGQPFLLRHPGSNWGFCALLKGTSVVVLKVERERWTFTPPTYNSCRTWDLNSQPLGYESGSLTIRPRLPQSARQAPLWGKKMYLLEFNFEPLCFNNVLSCINKVHLFLFVD